MKSNKSKNPVFNVGDKIKYRFPYNHQITGEYNGVVSIGNDNGKKKVISIELENHIKISAASIDDVKKISNKVFRNKTFVARMLNEV